MGVPTTTVVTISSPKLLFKFLPIDILSDPRPKFVIDPPLIMFMLGATTISTLVVVMTTLGDGVTSILTGCLQISLTVAYNILGELELTQV